MWSHWRAEAIRLEVCFRGSAFCSRGHSHLLLPSLPTNPEMGRTKTSGALGSMETTQSREERAHEGKQQPMVEAKAG